MLDVARHRGPNDQGISATLTASLGLNRLSIIDVKTGHQPIENEDGNLVLVCNGEIYNYKQLRSQLEIEGHIFRTSSDVEIILHLFEEEGVEGFQKLDGMFAFALLDKKNNRLYLGRDRVGIKPLYYMRANDHIIYFASEIKSLHEVCECRAIDTKILAEYLTWGYSTSGGSVWEEVKMLPPGYYLEFSPISHRLSSYVNHQSEEPFENPEIATKELRQVVIQNIESQLMSDVPLGVFLSGGIDSSIIVGVISKLLNLKVPTFSIDFPSEQYSEGDKIRQISALYKTDHHLFLAQSNLLDILDDVIKACDEPFGDPAALPTYFLAQETVKHVTVALSGDGSDEYMFGYNYYQPAKEGMFSLRKKWLRNVVEKIDFKHPLYYSLLSRSAEVSGKPINIYNLMRSNLFKLPKDNLNPKYNHKSDFDRNSYLPNDILYKTDRMTMYHSLEARVPFLGNSIIDVAKKIPKTFQIDNFLQKILLRKAFEDLLPPKIIDQPKHGFTTPVGDWVKDRYSESEFKSLFTHSFIADLTKSSLVYRIIHEHFRGLFNHGRFIYRLLVSIKWANEYKPSALSFK